MEKELLYSVALSGVKGIGPVYAKQLLRHFGEARNIFLAGEGELTSAGIPAYAVRAILSFQDFSSVEKEMTFLERKGIRILRFTDPDYPQRLSPIEEAPFLLFCKGKMDWNPKKILAIIGTRDPSEYGRQMTDRLIRDLSAPDLVILSGLAFGIDGAAHRAALKYGLPTIGVLGHGFGHVYPRQNADLFRAMASRGGLITEFSYHTRPAIYRFPLRNRIIAGMSDAVVVVETDTTGGSLGTIRKALEYRKEIFAVPARLTDPKSAGCNQLIAKGYARLLFRARQLVMEMKWDIPAAISGVSDVLAAPATAASTASTGAPTQSTLFNSDAGLSKPEVRLIKMLRENGPLSFDELAQGSSMDAASLAGVLLRLELRDLVATLPGNRYRPCT